MLAHDGSLCCHVPEIRAEFRPGLSDPVAATKADVSDLRFDFYDLRREFSSLRQEVGELRKDVDDLRFDVLRWSLAFWIGQVIAVAGLMVLMTRAGGG